MEKKGGSKMSFFGQVCPLGTKGPYQYVLMLSRYQGKWLLSRHRSSVRYDRERSAWTRVYPYRDLDG